MFGLKPSSLWTCLKTLTILGIYGKLVVESLCFANSWPLALFHSAPVQSIPTSGEVDVVWPRIEHRSGGTALRILCVGASITFGVGSTDGNGYRRDLRDLLEHAGSTVHYVGTQSSGNMKNKPEQRPELLPHMRAFESCCPVVSFCCTLALTCRGFASAKPHVLQM